MYLCKWQNVFFLIVKCIFSSRTSPPKCPGPHKPPEPNPLGATFLFVQISEEIFHLKQFHSFLTHHMSSSFRAANPVLSHVPTNPSKSYNQIVRNFVLLLSDINNHPQESSSALLLRSVYSKASSGIIHGPLVQEWNVKRRANSRFGLTVTTRPDYHKFSSCFPLLYNFS